MSLRRAIAEMDVAEVNVAAFCRDHGISRDRFYEIRRRYEAEGDAGLAPRSRAPHTVANRTSPAIEDLIVTWRKRLADDGLDAGAETIRWHLDADGAAAPDVSTIWRILTRRGFIDPDPSKAPHTAWQRFVAEFVNEMWQTDFTYFKIIGWGWYYLSTILDDYSRYIIAWKLCTNMRAEDVKDTIELALAASGCDQAVVRHKPRLLSDNGSCYISGDLAKWLEDQKMDHVRGAPFHPQTQGKIERWHQTMKNRVLLENYYLPGDLERQIEAFVEYYNNQRYHESLHNVTPADVYFGRDKAILREREKIKKLTIRQRRLQHQKQAA